MGRSTKKKVSVTIIKKGKPDKPKASKEVLVAQRNVDRRLKQGWKLINNDPRNSRGRLLGAKQPGGADVVLMEKK